MDDIVLKVRLNPKLLINYLSLFLDLVEKGENKL